MRKLSVVLCIFSLLHAQTEEFENLKKKWEKINDYTCILQSYIKKGDREEIRTYEYRFMKPGWVRMKILKGDNKGAVVVYDPETKKVKAKKGGILGILKLTFDPSNKRVTSIRGHRVDKSHFGAVLKRWQDYIENAEVSYKGVSKFEGKEALLFEAIKCDTLKYQGTYRELIWFDKTSSLLLGFEQFDVNGTLIHRVICKNIKTNVGLKRKDFKL